MSLKGKGALITGAGSGIGRASAMRFHQGGAAVMCADIDLAAAEDVANHIGQLGGKAEAFGKLDVLFNNAGVGSGPGWDATIKINLEGVYNGLYFGAEMMAERGGGSIINTASILGLVGMTPFPGEPLVPIDYGVGAYSASKGAVVMMTRQFAVMYGGRGVRVNALAPGFIKTPMTAQFRDVPEANDFLVSLHPMGRLGIPEEIANAAAFLASDEASFINGVILPVDGGYTAR